MALRAKAPQAIEKRLKIFIYGPAKVGKTTLATQFPKPYFIDCEKGAENDEYVRLMKDSDAGYLFLNDYDDLYKELTSLLVESHTYRTLVIDPLTVIYNDLLDKSAQTLKRQTRDGDATGMEFGRHKIEPDRKIKRLLNLINRLDMNVIITSHSKTKWTKIGKELVEDGITFDCYSKMDFAVDLGLEARKATTGERTAVVKYTRLGKEFPEDAVIPFTYAAMAERYGRDILERDARPTLLATPQQVEEFKRITALVSYDADLIEKGLAKAQANILEEMPRDTMTKWIAAIKEQIVDPKTESELSNTKTV
jgi:hypothetical protein